MKEKIFKKGNIKKLLSAVLSLAMVITLMPMNSMTAYAAEFPDCACSDPSHANHYYVNDIGGGMICLYMYSFTDYCDTTWIREEEFRFGTPEIGKWYYEDEGARGGLCSEAGGGSGSGDSYTSSWPTSIDGHTCAHSGVDHFWITGNTYNRVGSSSTCLEGRIFNTDGSTNDLYSGSVDGEDTWKAIGISMCMDRHSSGWYYKDPLNAWHRCFTDSGADNNIFTYDFDTQTAVITADIITSVDLSDKVPSSFYLTSMPDIDTSDLKIKLQYCVSAPSATRDYIEYNGNKWLTTNRTSYEVGKSYLVILDFYSTNNRLAPPTATVGGKTYTDSVEITPTRSYRFFIGLGTLQADGSFTPLHSHNFATDWSYDDTYHWHACSGEGSSTSCLSATEAAKAAHSGGTATCQTRPVCDTCHQAYGSTIPHSYTNYSVVGNELRATCSYSGCTEYVSLTLSADNASYTASPYTSASRGNTTAWTGASLPVPNITFEGRGNTTFASGTTAPTNVGTYTASITAGGQTASVDFEITKANRTALTASVANYAFEGVLPSPSLSGTPEESATPTYYYNTTNSNVGGSAWPTSSDALEPGTYYIYAVIPATANYNSYTTAAAQFTVSGSAFGTITATTPTPVTYDGQAHGMDPVTCVTGGVTVKYGTTEGTYNLTTAPTFANAGTHTVYYQVTKRGYTPETGSIDVVINPKEVTVSGIVAENKDYDGTTSITLDYSNVSITGKVTGDNVSVTATGTLDSANAGTDKTVTISGLTLTGTKAANYTLAASGNQTTATATVNKVAISISQPTSYAPTNIAGEPVIKENTGNPLVTASTNSLPAGITTEYKLDDGAWSGSIPTATGVSAGNHRVYYRFVGDANHNPLANPSWYVAVEVGSGSVSVTATGATSENLDVVGSANKVAGKDVTITLNVAPIADASTVTNKTAMESKVGNIFNGGSATKEYIDIHINKSVSGEGTPQKITDTTTPIEIAYGYILNAAKAYVIIRDHNGTVTAFKQLAARPTGSFVDGTYYLDVANSIVYIYSKYFSDYMIASASGHTVTFNTNGGSAVDQMIVSDGATIASLPTPTRSGYTFNGWYSDAGLSTAFTTATIVSGDIAVYAKWTQNSSGGSSSGSNGGSSSSDSSSSAETPKTITVTVNVTHTVVKGDTMSRIARKYGLTLAQLAALNPQIKNINRIYPGQLINVGTETKTVTETETKQAEVKAPSRSVTTYIVKKGDTLIKIARNNRMSLAEIAALNGQIKNLHWIYPGQVINIHK